MSKSRQLRRFSIGAAAGLVFALVGSLSAAPFEKALPADTAIFVNVNNLEALKTALGKTKSAMMLQDPLMRPFIEGISAEFQKLFTKLEQRHGLNVRELVSLPTGQATFALQFDPQDPKKDPFIFFMIEVKGKEAQAQTLLARLDSVLEEQGMVKRTDGDVVVVGKAEDSRGDQVVHVVKDGVLFLGNDASAIKATAAAIASGRQESFADNPRFKSFRDQSKGASDIEVLVDLSAITKIAKEQDPKAGIIIGVLGLEAFQSAGVSVNVGKGEFDLSVQVSVPVSGKSQLLGLVNMPARPMQPEAWVPKDIVSYASMNWDLDQFYSTLSTLITGLGGRSMADIDAMLAGPDPANPLLNIKTDLIGPLGNRISIIQDLDTSKKLPATRTNFAWQLDDGAKFNALIERIMALAGGALPVQKKTVKGNTVYMIPVADMLGGAFETEENPAPAPFGVVAFTVGTTHFHLATHVELLDKILNSEGASGLGEAPEYRKIAGKYPAASSIISFSRSDEQARAGWMLIKSGQMSNVLKQASGSSPEAADFIGGFAEALSGKNLPNFDDVKKYMTPSGSYAVMDETGFRWIQFSLKE